MPNPELNKKRKNSEIETEDNLVTKKAKNEAESKLTLTSMPDEIIDHIGSFIHAREKLGLLHTAQRFNFFQSDINDFFEMEELLQAILDDDVGTVKDILEANPELLHKTPKRNMIITNTTNGQKFYAEKPLALALKRGQLDMIETLLPFFAEENKNEILAQWPQITKEEQEDKQKKYEILLEKLAELIKNGSETDILAGLNTFRQKLMSIDPIKLDDYFDLDLLLIAVKKTYQNKFVGSPLMLALGSFYLRSIVGCIQLAVSPELGKIMCSGLISKFNYYVFGVNDRYKLIPPHAEVLKLQDQTPFYTSELGTKFCVGGFGQKDQGLTMCLVLSKFEILYQNKQNKLMKLREDVKSGLFFHLQKNLDNSDSDSQMYDSSDSDSENESLNKTAYSPKKL